MIRDFLKAVICITCGFLPLSCATRAPPVGVGPSETLAILGAFYPEVALLKDGLGEAQTCQIEGIEFIAGRIEDRPVVIAWTGVGKANAAMTTTLLSKASHCRLRFGNRGSSSEYAP